MSGRSRSDAGIDGGRVNQKWRTQTALLAAAAELLREGKRPTIAEAADRAMVSRATAYRYFKSQEALAREATLEGGVVPELDRIEAEIGDSEDPAERLDRLVTCFQSLVVEQEQTLRELLRMTLQNPPDGESARVRGSYRPRWLAQVLEPLGEELNPSARRRLVAALSLCMGTEAQIVLCEVNKLSAEEAAETCHWAAQALLETARREVGAARD